MSRSTIEVKILRAGQPRAYADSFYEAEIEFKNWWNSTTGEREGKWDPDENFVRQITRMMVQPYADNAEWHQARLEKIEKLGVGKWKVLVVEPYLD